MTQSEREKIYDDILNFLAKEKGSVTVDGIVKGTNEYYRERNKILKELKSKGLVKEDVNEYERQSPLGGGTFIEHNFRYSISEDGDELVRKGGFKKKLLVYFRERPDLIIMAAIALVSLSLNVWHLCSPIAPDKKEPLKQEEQPLNVLVPTSELGIPYQAHDSIH